MPRIVILTGSFLRHDFMRKSIALDPDIKVLKTYCEKTDENLISVVVPEEEGAGLQYSHLVARDLSERDFFFPFVTLTPDYSNPLHIPFGDINEKCYCDEIRRLKPDLIVAYGCSLIKDPLLSAFAGKILNVHLGLSPYYRGTGTNFWPLVNGDLECVGATFMYMDAGIDTGEIIHQIRARIYKEDTPHQIGNRLISDVAMVYVQVIKKSEKLVPMEPLPIPENARFYVRKDFSPESVRDLYMNFENGIVEQYLSERDERIKRAPTITNPTIACEK